MQRTDREMLHAVGWLLPTNITRRRRRRERAGWDAKTFRAVRLLQLYFLFKFQLNNIVLSFLIFTQPKSNMSFHNHRSSKCNSLPASLSVLSPSISFYFSLLPPPSLLHLFHRRHRLARNFSDGTSFVRCPTDQPVMDRFSFLIKSEMNHLHFSSSGDDFMNKRYAIWKNL